MNMTLEQAKKALCTDGCRALYTTSDINRRIFEFIKSYIKENGRVVPLMQWSTPYESIKETPKLVSFDAQEAIFDDCISICKEILEEESYRSETAIVEICNRIRRYRGRRINRDACYPIPSELILSVCAFLVEVDPEFDSGQYLMKFNPEIHRYAVSDMTGVSSERLSPQPSYKADLQFSSNDDPFFMAKQALPGNAETTIFFVLRNSQEWDAHYPGLSDIYEILDKKIYVYTPHEQSSLISIVYMEDSEVYFHITINRSLVSTNCRPRLYYLACRYEKEDNRIYRQAFKELIAPKQDYACHVSPDYSTHRGESRGGWEEGKSFNDPYLLKVRNNGLYSGFGGIFGPAIVVDLDRYKSFVYWEKDIPYLLDNNECAFVITNNAYGLERLSKSMDDKLSKIFFEIEHDRQLTPVGRKFTMSYNEKVYVVLHSWELLIKRMSRKPASDNRFGYDERTWNRIIENEDRIDAFIMALNTEEDEISGDPIVRVEECDDGNFKLTKNMSKRDAALFAYLVSCILGIWDYSKNKNDDDSGTDRCYVGKDLSFNDNCFRNTSSMCSSYFDVRFSLPKDTIRKSKKYALDCLSTLREGRDWPDACGEAAVVKAKAIFNLVTKTTLKLH